MLTIPSRSASFKKLEILSAINLALDRVPVGLNMHQLRVLQLYPDDVYPGDAGDTRDPSSHWQLLHSFLPALQTLCLGDWIPTASAPAPFSSQSPHHIVDPITPHLTYIRAQISYSDHIIPFLESASIPPTHVHIHKAWIRNIGNFDVLTWSLNNSKTKQFEKLSIDFRPIKDGPPIADWRTELKQYGTIVRLVKACQKKGSEVKLFYLDEDFGPLGVF
jgi:hypothetical protein